jgi:NAD+ synthetase
MKIRQENTSRIISKDLKILLNEFREKRNFIPSEYLELKTDLINSYFSKSNLSTAVIALSGGIDSAVVLGLIKIASLKKDSPIKNIISITLPALNSNGVSNQIKTINKAKMIADHFGIKLHEVSVENISNLIKNSVNKEFSLENSSWAEGQLIAYTRTPILYYVATLLNDNGKPGLICGTTNRDEGSYLGFVGKASDGMVDLQIISDLHKSEVYKIAKLIKLPKPIINQIPNGDMFDNKKDEDVFGAPYDFVELYSQIKNFSLSQKNDIQRYLRKNKLDEEFSFFAKNLEKLHFYNKHKYDSKSPAIHLDIYESGVTGGWELDYTNKFYNDLLIQGNIIKENFVSPVPLGSLHIKHLENNINNLSYNYINGPKKEVSKIVHEDIVLFKNLLDKDVLDSLVTLFNKEQKNTVYTNENGRITTGENVYSKRSSLYNVKLSMYIWKQLKQNIKPLYKALEPNTEWNLNEIWKPIGINPLFRYIYYENNGFLVPHYDGSVNMNENNKTLYSLILYLSNNKTGKTRFYQDTQKSLWNKDLNDKPKDIEKKLKTIFTITPNYGDILLFPHHILHDSEDLIMENKLIMRSDIVFEKIKFS